MKITRGSNELREPTTRTSFAMNRPRFRTLQVAAFGLLA